MSRSTASCDLPARERREPGSVPGLLPWLAARTRNQPSYPQVTAIVLPRSPCPWNVRCVIKSPVVYYCIYGHSSLVRVELIISKSKRKPCRMRSAKNIKCVCTQLACIHAAQKSKSSTSADKFWDGAAPGKTCSTGLIDCDWSMRVIGGNLTQPVRRCVDWNWKWHFTFLTC